MLVRSREVDVRFGIGARLAPRPAAFPIWTSLVGLAVEGLSPSGAITSFISSVSLFSCFGYAAGSPTACEISQLLFWLLCGLINVTCANMVYCGKPSKSCRQCRLRNIKVCQTLVVSVGLC
jgi:hypothetical protein